MKHVEALSFDLDGTLLDGSPWREVIVRTCREIAAALPDLEAERLVEANGEVWESYWPNVEGPWVLGILDGRTVTTEAWHRTLLACGSDEESSTLFAVETYLRNRRDALRLFDDVRPLFNALKPRIPIALVTNGASDTQREVLQVLGIEHEFGAVVISGEVGLAKPDPAIFGPVVDKLRIRPDQAWHIGDNLRVDVAGAKNAGLVAVWMNRQGARREQGDPEPDYELRSLLELPRLLST